MIDTYEHKKLVAAGLDPKPDVPALIAPAPLEKGLGLPAIAPANGETSSDDDVEI